MKTTWNSLCQNVFFPSLNGLSTIWFNVNWQFVDYAILMKIICYVDVNVMAYLHNMWVFFFSSSISCGLSHIYALFDIELICQ
jgi:hypothetical protein